MKLTICPKCLGHVVESYEDGPSCEDCFYTGDPVRVEFDLDEPGDVIRSRKPFRWRLGPGPEPDALDRWLAEDGPMPEVEAALA